MAKEKTKFNIIKNPHIKLAYTPFQLNEIHKCMNDPLYFIENYMYIKHPVKGKVKFEPWNFQKQLILAYWKNLKVVALYPRQVGKCQTADSIICIKNQNTGGTYDIPIGIFYEYQKAKKRGEKYDIEKYLRKKMP